ncbi:MAG: cation:proton antiporter [Spirochaetes bacterium]|nr:cation:proton antiporter [Spirochaetota bacterium]
MDFFHYVIDKISLLDLNILILMGVTLFGGTIGGRLFQKIKIPQVVGYIIIGIIIGGSGLNVVDDKIIRMLEPFNYLSLGIIGFMIGGELKRSVLKRYGKQFFYILIFEGMMAFFLVMILTGIVAFLITKDMNLSVSLAVLLGAIASATAPAATTDVFWEYKSRGPLTTTVLGIVALDDALSLVLFAFASTIASTLISKVHIDTWHSLIAPFYEIGGSLLIGGGLGYVLSRILKQYSEEDRILVFSIGTILMVIGLSLTLNMDMLLAAMAMGVVMTNVSPYKSKLVFNIVERFTPPIYVLFFVLVGSKLKINNITFFVGILTLAYFLGRTGGKIMGARWGAILSHATDNIKKYLPYCLFSQAGVAIGLAILVSQRFPEQIGNTIIFIIMTSTFVVQLIGPLFVKMAIFKSHEDGLNITEEDLIRNSLVKDLMEKKIPPILETMPITKILSIFSEHDFLYYPVMNNKKKLEGVITIDNLKNMFITSELNYFMLAHDIMEPVIKVVLPQTPLSEALDIFKRYNLEYLPIVDQHSRVLGLLESKNIKHYINRKMLETEQKAEKLHQNQKI